MTHAGFSAYVSDAATRRRLVVQPRMGFAQTGDMRAGLEAVKQTANLNPRVGTVSIDAYTRLGQIEAANEALGSGAPLNGFPLVSHGPDATIAMLDGLRDSTFPVQIRHGTPLPQQIFRAAAEAGFDAIEGGPVSYNLPYSRVRLADTIAAWASASRFWADYGDRQKIETHIETFAGCMFGQFTPPGLLVALSVLEALFFEQNGICSLSVSLTQGINDDQDVGALLALSELASVYLSETTRHIVFYTFMGLFPETTTGARAIIEESARISVRGGAHRLIVKTAAEASGIPTIVQNIEAMGWARAAADQCDGIVRPEALHWASIVADEADALIRSTLRLAPSVGDALLEAFSSGRLDIPFCSHPDNRNEARAATDPDTRALAWSTAGNMPIAARRMATRPLNSKQFHDMLDLNRRRYDGEECR